MILIIFDLCAICIVKSLEVYNTAVEIFYKRLWRSEDIVNMKMKNREK
jgi:hypothetical protein